jgi:hypothetical protein
VDSLKGQATDQGKELKEIAKEIHGFKVGLTVATTIISAVFAVSAAIIGFIMNHLAEVVQAFIAAKK